MNYSEWESCLVNELKGLSSAECIKITSYYREMYGDKLDAGISEEQILSEFGSPKSCAEKILTENAGEQGDGAKNAPAVAKKTSNAGQKTKNIILAVLFSLFAGIPLAATLASIVISLGAICISGTAGILASFVYVFVMPFQAVGAGIAAHIGIGIGAMGACGFLGLGGYFATKYSAIYSYKLMKVVYRGILK